MIDIIDFAIENQFEYDDDSIILQTIQIAFYAKSNNYQYQPLDSNFYSTIDNQSSVDFIDPIQALNFSRLFVAHCAIIKQENPTWGFWKVFIKGWSDTTHLVADFAGLVPVVGEFADLANGILYTIEGDGANATLSFASTIPIGGWFAAGVKFAKRADGLKFIVVGANDLITFGATNSTKFRAACGIALRDATKQAHHILPRGTQIIEHEVVQKAAKSTLNQGFHIDSALNGIAVATWRNQPNHNIYNALIKSKLDALPSNLTPNQAYTQLLSILNQAKQAIINNPNTHLNDLIF